MEEVSIKEKISTPYVCGGVARDFYMKKLKQIKDIDITTGDLNVHKLADKTYEELIKTIHVQLKQSNDLHRTIFFKNISLDFSSNFVIPNIDYVLKNYGVKDITPMKKELYSRDFTCNSLLLTMDMKNIVDLTNRGVKDINEKMVRTILDPEITLTNSKNRVIRSIYSAVKLGFEIDPKIVEYVKAHPETINISAQKTVIEKLVYCFEHDPEKTKKYLTLMNLWDYLPMSKETEHYYQEAQKSKLLKASAPIRQNYDYGEGVFMNLDRIKSITEFFKKKRKQRQNKIKNAQLPSFIDGYDRSFMDNPEVPNIEAPVENGYLVSPISTETNVIPQADEDGKKFPTPNYSYNLDSKEEGDPDLEGYADLLIGEITGEDSPYRIDAITDAGEVPQTNKYYVEQDPSNPETDRRMLHSPIKTNYET
jgi:tRNA nucleotidyltransferase/poly(A) polymerase